MSAPVNLPPASAPAVNTDLCPACGHQWHGLACARTDVERTATGIVQTPCGCPGPWAAA